MMVGQDNESAATGLRNSLLDIHEAIYNYCLLVATCDIQSYDLTAFRQTVNPVIRTLGDSMMWSAHRLDEIVDVADYESEAEAKAARLRDCFLEFHEVVFNFSDKLSDPEWKSPSVEDCRRFTAGIIEKLAIILMSLTRSVDDLVDIAASEQPVE